MKKEIDIDSRIALLYKIKECYKDYPDLLFKIVENAVMYYSKENNCVVWCWDKNTFLDFLNMGIVDTDYFVYRFELLNGQLVTKKA